MDSLLKILPLIATLAACSSEGISPISTLDDPTGAARGGPDKRVNYPVSYDAISTQSDSVTALPPDGGMLVPDTKPIQQDADIKPIQQDSEVVKSSPPDGGMLVPDTKPIQPDTRPVLPDAISKLDTKVYIPPFTTCYPYGKKEECFDDGTCSYTDYEVTGCPGSCVGKSEPLEPLSPLPYTQTCSRGDHLSSYRFLDPTVTFKCDIPNLQPNGLPRNDLGVVVRAECVNIGEKGSADAWVKGVFIPGGESIDGMCPEGGICLPSTSKMGGTCFLYTSKSTKEEVLSATKMTKNGVCR